MKAEINSFIDEAGHNRVLIDGKVQPVRYTHLAPISDKPQTLNWGNYEKPN